MNTTEIIIRLPKNVQDRTKEFRDRYSKIVSNMEYDKISGYSIEVNGYCKALNDVGLISKEEKQRIYSYLTI